METVSNFRRYPRNPDFGDDENDSVPLTPFYRWDHRIESTGVAGTSPLNAASRSDGAPSHMGRTLPSAPPHRDTWSQSPTAPQHREAWPQSTTATPRRNASAYHGRERARERELSELEEYHLQKARRRTCGQTGYGVFPKFFPNIGEAGKELKAGLNTIWGNFIIVEVMLVSIAIQPFITIPPKADGWRAEVYGLLWILVLVIDCMGLALTALFLGYLHAYPGKLTYMWVCSIVPWVAIPSILVILGTFVGLVAIGYTSWILYGLRAAIVCGGLVLSTAIFCFLAAIGLAKAAKSMEALE